jgi:hypothetical protein
LGAFFAAHEVWSIARMISSIASACGLPVSACTTSASCADLRVSTPFHRWSRSARPSNPSPAHQSAASRAMATAASTSAAVWTGWVPTTSSVAGFSESKVSCFASTAVMTGPPRWRTRSRYRSVAVAATVSWLAW